MAVLLVLHGLARIRLGIVDDFGEFLREAGAPVGAGVAWLVTLVEVAGGVALAAGRRVRMLSAWFALQLLARIALVHAREGWFVVGVGRNGMEYSVLLVLLLGVVWWTAGKPRGVNSGDSK